jgi:hypothetical protein
VATVEVKLMPPSKEKLIQELRKAVHAYMSESPAVGGSSAMEWAVTGRVAMHLARSARVRAWEKHDRVTVDAEYAQQGVDGMGKGKHGSWMKPDLIIHCRTQMGPDSNWLVVEFKMHDEQPKEVWHRDLVKLQRAKRDPFRYGLALWVSIPRSSKGPVFHAEIAGDEGEQPTIKTFVQL